MATIISTISTYSHHLIDSIKARPRSAALTSTAVALTLSLAWIVQDFHDWKAFGTGGTPPTWAGYWRMTKLRIHRMLLLGKDDLTDPTPLSGSGRRYLDAGSIPVRQGSRPQLVSRTMPQRQMPYKPGTIEPGVAERVSEMTATFAAKYPDILDLKPSKTEGGSADAIYAKPSLPTLNEKAKHDRILTSEIAHHHPAELSFHVWVSEADAKTIVEKKWGQRFPLPGVDKGWVMLYTPRTAAEVDVVERIVRAAIAWVSGVEV
ncbi:hypothetical protein A1O3_00430 [Capronia epimyces CBS 606.96]|uniref:Luciferase domain-containing protein n=1 Tax=Capronia epimyces CBS 606.96 TaxID=1182542 RepID=W9YQG5_9EURO|nr:uncharacterized protein A1O3_00430 [Capronia epimyces CBS 606.96]EXJ91880.1 hypothetical protein A1O3_00430 [Capronia epimyces CBS 606.96]